MPGLSEEQLPNWREEGEPGAKLTEVCPSSEHRTPFAEETSRLLRGPDGARARSGGVFFLEQSDARPYTQELFADAANCAARLLQAWFGERAAFGPAQTAQIGEEAVIVVSAAGAPAAAAVFFRREEGVAAVVQVGGDASQSVRQLAATVDAEIADRLGGGGSS